MNSLLVSSTPREIAGFLQHYRHDIKEKDTDVLITGIGLTSTAYSLAKQVNIKKPSCIIQAGIAGCFDKNIPLGTVVVVKKDTIADMGVMENNKLKTMFDLRLIPFNHYPFRKGWLINKSKELVSKTQLPALVAISVNHITTTKKMTGVYIQSFRPDIESMEGAAMHYVCLMEKIPFLQIRSISNYIGERDKRKWKINEAIANLNKELVRIIDSGILKSVVSTNNG